MLRKLLLAGLAAIMLLMPAFAKAETIYNADTHRYEDIDICDGTLVNKDHPHLIKSHTPELGFSQKCGAEIPGPLGNCVFGKPCQVQGQIVNGKWIKVEQGFPLRLSTSPY
jgi:hypothetical protein